MTFRWATAIATLLAFCVAAWKLDLGALFAAFQPATVALSIMAAAVLVRLNRGMPTLDWKTLEPDGRKRLTAKIVDLQKDYLSLLAINTVLVGALIGLVIVTPIQILAWACWVQRVASGLLVAGMVLVVSRMGLVVWRDYDIVKLQKTLIDAAADVEHRAAEEEKALRSLEAMRAGLRQAPPAKIKDWDGRDEKPGT